MMSSQTICSRHFVNILICAIFVGGGSFAAAQTPKTKDTVTYTSNLDQTLTIKTIALAGVRDNVDGIYAAAIIEEMQRLMQLDSQWSFIDKKISPLGFNQLFDDTNARKKVCADLNVDAVLTGRLIRGVGTIALAQALISCKDLTVIAFEETRNFTKLDLQEVRGESQRLYTALKNQLPYTGLVLSRTGIDLTINVGKGQGLKLGDELNVAQIVAVQRHPKLQFITRSEKVILGRIRVTQVDDTASIAKILFELEKGVIQTNSKVLGIEAVKYANGQTPTGATIDLMGKEQPLAFGENPKEWSPPPKPQYGSLSLLAGISQYANTVDTQMEGALDVHQPITPTVALSGELWLSDLWFLFLGTKQAFFSASNPASGGSPSQLDYYLAHYDLGVGYNFLLNGDFWGPKFKAYLGMSQFISRVSENTPITFTNMQYGGTFLGLSGQFSLEPQIPLTFGAGFNYYFLNSVSESGKSSGSASGAKTYQFTLYGLYPLQPSYSLFTRLDFENYSNDFSGPGDRLTNPATSASHRLLSLLAGINYLF